MTTIQPKKLVSVFILEILKKYSDDSHKLTQKFIIDKLSKDYQMVVDRKTVQRNLRDLIACGEFDIEYTEKNRKKHNPDNGEEIDSSLITNVYLQQPISKGELRLLIDSVLFSQSITSTQASDLIDQLKKLSSIHVAKSMSHVQLVKTLYRTKGPDLFLNIEELQNAILNNHKVKFHLKAFGKEHELVATKETVIIEPYQLIASKGFYYLIGWNNGLVNFRIDRITDVCETDKSCSHSNKLSSSLGYETYEYLSSHPFLTSGNPVKCLIRIQKENLGDIFDSFGHCCSVQDETDDHYDVTAYAAEEDMYLWALQYVDSATVLEPQKLRDRLRKTALRMHKKYCRSERDRYLWAIEIARGKAKALSLVGNKLEERNEYKEIKDLEYIELINNTGLDLSLLCGQTKLHTLKMRNQLFDDLSLFSDSSELTDLLLWQTGIKNISFLKEFKKLDCLMLDEPYIQNPEILYVLKLKELRLTDITATGVDIERIKANGVDVIIQQTQF